jgi:hypothetical protein
MGPAQRRNIDQVRQKKAVLIVRHQRSSRRNPALAYAAQAR